MEPPLTSNEVMYGKGKRKLEAALRLLGDDANAIDAKTLDDACTQALIAVRVLQRLAGRIDVPRPEPIKVEKKRPKPKTVKTPEPTARRGSVGKTQIIDVSGAEAETKPLKTKKLRKIR